MGNFLTFALCVLTGVLAIATWRMATATQQLTEVTSAPYLTLQGFDVTPALLRNESTGVETAGVRPQLRLKNPGQVRVTYDVQKIAITLAGSDLTTTDFENHIGVIHPGEDTLFLYPFVAWSGQLSPGMSGTLDFEAQFWATPQRRQTLKLKFRFTVTGLDPRRIEWVYLEGPTYL